MAPIVILGTLGRNRRLAIEAIPNEGGYIASRSRGPGTERDIQRRALDWPTQRDPRPLTSADTLPIGLGTAAPQAALISGLACVHPLEADVEDMIAQLDGAQARFTAIGPGHRGDSTASQSPGAQPGSS